MEAGEPIMPLPALRAETIEETSLDPLDWDAFRRTAHRALDTMIDDLASVEDRPVWQNMPDDLRGRFREDLPRTGSDLDDLLEDVRIDIAPYVTGNRHPLFMGWVHGAGTPVGMIAEMIAAGLNANCGGRDHVGIEVEKQVTRWAAQLFDFPQTASGVFVTGTSMANFLGLLIARTQTLGKESRAIGQRDVRLTIYAAEGAHGCVAQALEMAGIGSDALRTIPTDGAGGLIPDALDAAIMDDWDRGFRPMMIVGTAGSVNTGSIDPLDAVADIARRHGLWFHIDGAFGALAALSPDLKPMLAGIERADSIAFDFHKWAHVPYDAGFLLVKDAEAHRHSFSDANAYLQRAPRGIAAGDIWPCDLGPDLSRGSRAFKTWFAFRALGADRIGESIARCCRVAAHLEASLRASPLFEVVAPANLNIVCWRLAKGHDDALNNEITMDLHESGLAVPSMTTIEGRPAIRAAIVNHRTTEAHIDGFLVDMQRIAKARIASG